MKALRIALSVALTAFILNASHQLTAEEEKPPQPKVEDKAGEKKAEAAAKSEKTAEKKATRPKKAERKAPQRKKTEKPAERKDPQPKRAEKPLEKKEARDEFLQKLNANIIEITKRCTPMVVNISAQREAPRGQVFEYDMYGNPLRQFPQRAPIEPRAMGSGVIIDKRGYIVTNHHVVKNTKAIRITLADRREFPCDILGADPATDIAVIKITGKVPGDLPVVEMADSDRIEVGEMVIAIGNPFGFSHTVTTGIISATGRQSMGLADYENFIQTDAAINPGNSGGALINIDGKLIGINTAIFSRTGGSMGIGFAIPSNMLREIAGELIATGKVVRGWLGVYIQDVTKDIADSFKFTETGGALVSDIIKGSPAEGSEIQKGDIIVSVNKQKVESVNHLRRLVSLIKPGSKATLSVFRGGRPVEIAMTIGTLPERPLASAEMKKDGEDVLGLVAKDIDEDLAYRFRTADKSGVVITGVRPGSAAARAGLVPGDVVKEVERRPIDSLRAYNDALSMLRGKTKVLLLITHAGTHRFVILEMEER